MPEPFAPADEPLEPARLSAGLWVRRPSRMLWALGVALALLVMALGAGAVWHLHRVAVREAEASVRTLNDVLSDDVARLFELIERTFRQSLAEVRATDPGDPEAMRALQARLFGRVESGVLLKGLRVESGGRLEIAGLPFLLPAEEQAAGAPRDKGGNGGGRLHVGVPFKDAGGHWRLVVSRPIAPAPGLPGGTVAALVDLEHLQSFFRGVDLKAGGAVSIFRDDGVRLIRWPHHEASTGQSFADISLFTTHLPASREGVYWDADTVFDTARVFAYRQPADLPVVVGVSSRQGVLMAGWRDQALIIGAATAALALAVLAICVLVAQQIAQRERLTEALRRLAQAREAGGPPPPA